MGPSNHLSTKQLGYKYIQRLTIPGGGGGQSKSINNCMVLLNEYVQILYSQQLAFACSNELMNV